MAAARRARVWARRREKERGMSRGVAAEEGVGRPWRRAPAVRRAWAGGGGGGRETAAAARAKFGSASRGK